MPEKPFEISEEDFVKTLMDYEMFKKGINVKEFQAKLIHNIMYVTDIDGNNNININLRDDDEN